jgi:death on curing protein
MTQWTWIEESVVWAVHEAQLAEHGGSAGVRDAGLLASALARPLNLAAYDEQADAAALAAAYGFGIARNHPFIDGNKRTAFVCCELFLALNGVSLEADDGNCVSTMLALAAGDIGEAEFAAWLRTHTAPL